MDGLCLPQLGEQSLGVTPQANVGRVISAHEKTVLLGSRAPKVAALTQVSGSWASRQYRARQACGRPIAAAPLLQSYCAVRCSRNSRFSTFPLGFLGKASTNSTRLGTLNPANCA